MPVYNGNIISHSSRKGNKKISRWMETPRLGKNGSRAQKLRTIPYNDGLQQNRLGLLHRDNKYSELADIIRDFEEDA